MTLNIDLTNVFSQVQPITPTPDVIKSIPSTEKKSKPKTNKIQTLKFGDFTRLSNLPDIVSEEFLSHYKENIAQILLPFVNSGVLSINYAGTYVTKFMETVFGNNDHKGIFDYLKVKNKDGVSDKELVCNVEKLILKGWSIQKENNRFWIINEDFKRVVDVSGSTKLSKKVEDLIFAPSSAHLFIDESVASKINALAKKLQLDADNLANSGSLDLLLGSMNDNKFAGYILNYNNFRKILEKRTKYRILEDGLTIKDLYNQGYRFDTQIAFPTDKYVFLTKGQDKLVIEEINTEINLQYGLHKAMLSALASNIKDQMFKGTNIINDSISEISELNTVFAFAHNILTLTHQPYTDSLDIVKKLQNDNKFLELLSVVFVTEYILLGNNYFSVNSFNFDNISNRLTSFSSLDYFTNTQLKKSDSETQNIVSDSFFRFDTVNVDFYLSKLPSWYKSKLKSLVFTFDKYPYTLDSIYSYLENARRFILGV